MSGSAGNESLVNSDINDDNHDDGASQSSQRSLGGRSVSLLERIQRQRELEATSTINGTSTGGSDQVNSNGTVYNPNISLVSQQHQLPPQQIHVPQYGPMPGFGNNTIDSTHQPVGTAPLPQQQQQGYLNNAWNNFAQGMDTSMMAGKSQMNLSSSHDNDEMHHSLLQPPTASSHDNHMNSSGGHTGDEYSISQYFLTFVKDVYGLFLSMPIIARIIVVAGLLYIVVKLI